MISIRNLCKALGGRPVLDGATLEIPKGETVVVLGPSGSGKTTLLRCIVGLERADSGEIEVDGICLRADDPPATRAARLRAVRAHCGMVFQQFHLFPHLDVLRNLTLAPMRVKGISAEDARRDALELLEGVGLRDFASTRITKLSGGEQQRVAIARALAMEPEYLLYDEPTSSLDRERAREVWKLMEKLAGDGQTQVVVTHQEELTRAIPCRVVNMRDGRVSGA